MRTPPILLSIVIPVYNGAETIGRCLTALFDSEFRAFEVIVVDDKSTDGTVAIIDAFPCKLIRSSLNNGPAAARNLGASHTNGQYLFFLDADILVDKSSLSQIMSTFSNRPEIDALFGSFHPESIPLNFFSRYKNLVHHYTHQNAREDAATFCGGFGAIRRDAFFKIGGFDPQYRFLEDVEMGQRLHRAGMKISLQKSLRFHHCKRYDLAALIRCDLFQRAVPWTRLILRTGVIRNDLNTKTHNVLSVFIAYLLVLGLPVFAFAYGAALWFSLLLLLIILNSGILATAWRVGDPWFAVRVAFTCWLIYLCSGLGLVFGALGHLNEELRGESREVEPTP